MDLAFWNGGDGGGTCSAEVWKPALASSYSNVTGSSSSGVYAEELNLGEFP